MRLPGNLKRHNGGTPKKSTVTIGPGFGNVSHTPSRRGSSLRWGPLDPRNRNSNSNGGGGGYFCGLSWRHFPFFLLGLSVIGSLIFALTFHGSDFFSAHEYLDRPRVGAYYYAWYGPLQWETWKTKYPPTLGKYESHDKSILRQHSQWAYQAGIDFFVMSWSTPANHVNVIQYLQYPATIPIAVHVETMILYTESRVNGTDPTDGLIHFHEPCQDIHIKANNGKNDTIIPTKPFGDLLSDYLVKIMTEIVLPYRHKYIFVDDKRPVFVLHLAKDYADFDKSFVNIRKRFLQEFGVQPYFIADVISFNDDSRVLYNTAHVGTKSWDAITSYDRYDGTRRESLDVYLNRTESEFKKYSNERHSNKFNEWLSFFGISRRTRLPVVPYVQPGYDDLLIPSQAYGNKKNKNLTRTSYDRENGKMYHAFWDIAERLMAENPCDYNVDEQFVLVTSFNEWHQSTAIEPSLLWHDMYLDITKKRSRRIKPNLCNHHYVRPSPSVTL